MTTTTAGLGWGDVARKGARGYHLTLFSQPANRRLPRHEHRHVSACIVVRGSYVEQARGRDTDCPAGAVMFKPAGEPHADQFGGQGGLCLLVEIPSERLEVLEPLAKEARQPFVRRGLRLAALGRQLYHEFGRDDPAAPLAMEGLILELLAESSRGERPDGGPREPVWLSRARELIHARFREPLTISAIAHTVGVDPSHLAKQFRRFHAASIGEYVRRLRIDRAISELEGTDASLTEIALRLGFYDQSHFTRAFKSATGRTPGQVRRTPPSPIAPDPS